MGSPLPTLFRARGCFFSFGATPPLFAEAQEVVEAEPIGGFNRDPMDLVVTTTDRLVVNHLLRDDFFELCAARESFGRS